jgi:hypothetical protein
MPSLKKTISKFQKVMKTNVDIFNDVTYKHAKKLYEILFIVGYTKMKKSAKICRFENVHTRVVFI